VHFKKEEKRSKIIFKCPAARSLFVIKSISDLPNELSVKILSYFDAKELMGLRCVSIYLLVLILFFLVFTLVNKEVS